MVSQVNLTEAPNRFLVHPSAQLGLCIIKFTLGLMSHHGIVTGSYWHDTPGPLARFMKGVSILLEIIVRTDRYDHLKLEAVGHELEESMPPKSSTEKP